MTALNTYDRHLLREWMKILGIVVGATVGLLLVQVAYDDFRRLSELGATGRELAGYFLVTVPSFLALVLPMALLVSLLFVLGKLHRANEFTALRAAGVSIARITAPIWVVGVLACGLTGYLNASVVPWSVETSRSLRNELEFRHQASTLPDDRIGAVYSVTFDDRAADRMWFMNRYSQFTHRAYGVMVSELDAQRRETQRIVARLAWYDTAANAWVFRDGRLLTFDPESGNLLKPEPFQQLVRNDFHENPKLMLLIGRRPVDLSFFELRRLIRHFRAEGSKEGVAYAVRYYGLITDTLGPLLVIALAIPFAVSGVRVNPAVGVSKSIGLFFLYYLLLNLAASLATKGLVDPVLAAVLPYAGMAAVAGWCIARLR